MKILNHEVKVTIEIRKIEKPVTPAEIDLRFIEMNNLYLQVERAGIKGRKISLSQALRLRELVEIVYPLSTEETMNQYWADEFMKLPGWLDC